MRDLARERSLQALERRAQALAEHTGMSRALLHSFQRATRSQYLCTYMNKTNGCSGLGWNARDCALTPYAVRSRVFFLLVGVGQKTLRQL